MNAARAIAALVRLELATRLPVLATALLVGIAAIPLSYLTRQQPVVFAVALGVAFCLGGAGLLGAAMLAEPIAHGRVGFYLAQPLSTAALWWGRLLGVTLVAIGAGVAAVAPAWLWRAARLEGSEREAIFLWALSLLAALPVAAIGHAIATLLRVRTSRAAFDFAAVLAVAALTGWSARALGDAALDARYTWLVLAALAPVLAIAAGQAQLWRGRGDVERGHLALSTTLWSPLLLVALGTVAVTSWALDLEPGDVAVDNIGPLTADDSRWVVLGGAVWEQPRLSLSSIRGGLYAQFLIDVETGDWARLGPPVHWRTRGRYRPFVPTLAADGSRVAWASRDGNLYWADLPNPVPEQDSRTSLELRLLPYGLPPQLADSHTWGLSPDGRHLAAIMTRTGPRHEAGFRHAVSLQVIELDTGRLMFSESLPWPAEVVGQDGPAAVTAWPLTLRWRDATRLELAGCLVPREDPTRSRVEPEYAALADLEVIADPQRGGAFARVRSYPHRGCRRTRLSHNGENTYLVSGTRNGVEIELRDTGGAPSKTVLVPSREVIDILGVDAGLLLLTAIAGDSIDYGFSEDVRLEWFEWEGRQLGQVDIGDRVKARFGNEVAPGELVVLVRDPGETTGPSALLASQRLLLFDFATGELRPVERPALPAYENLGSAYREPLVWALGLARWPPEPGSLSSKLYFSGDRSLVLLDLEQGTRRVVQAPPGSRSALTRR